MLRELAKLSGGMLLLGGYVTTPDTARLLAGGESGQRSPAPRDRGNDSGGREYARDWRTPVELLLLGAIWGGSFMFQRVAAPALGAAPMVDARLVLGALILLPFLWRERRRFPLSRWPQLAAIGVVNTLVPFLLFAWCSEHAQAGVGAIVDSMAVPFAVLAAFVMFGDRIHRRQMVGLFAGLIGVAVLAGGSLAGTSLGLAVAAGTLASLLYGISANLVKRFLSDLPPVAVAASTLITGAVLLAPFAAWTWPHAPMAADVWWSVLALGFVCTGIAYALYFRLIQRVGAARAATVTYLVPIFGVLWAWLALGEPLTPSMAAGGALILGGLLYGQRKPGAIRRSASLDERCVNCSD